MRRVFRAFFMCLSMFSAIPFPYRPWDEDARDWMLLCLPLVGAVIGALWYALAALAGLFLPHLLTAVVIAALPYLLTGFIHLDGFMDTSDAVLSRRSLEERLRILKDSNCGAFSVISLALLLLFMLGAADAALSADLRLLLFIPIASRCMSVICVTTLPPIAQSQYNRPSRSPGGFITGGAVLLIALTAGWLWLGQAAVIAVAATALGYGGAMTYAFRSLRGVSGDLAGYALTIGELCGLLSVTILSSGGLL